MTVWKLHTGLNGDGGLLDTWIPKGIATVGFSHAEPVSEASAQELTEWFAARERPGAATQLVAFRDEMKLGDIIVAPARQRGVCWIGRVQGRYEWSSTPVAGDHHHSRAVTWITELAIDEVPAYADPALRQRWTLSRLSGDVAAWFRGAADDPDGAHRISATARQGPDTKTGDAWHTPVGALMTRDERMVLYGGAKYGGIEPSASTGNVFLYSDTSRGKAFGYNFDGWDADAGCFLYTGEGRVGDQLMRDGNRAIFEHAANRRALRLFVARSNVPGTRTKLNEYIGQFALDNSVPYEIAEAPGGDGELRTVFVFRLQPVGHAARQLSDESAAIVDGVRGAALVDVEAANVATFAVSATEPSTAERRESALVDRYAAHLREQGTRLRRWKLSIPGELGVLLTDIYDEDANELYEAKGTATRDSIRRAIGQLLDYRRHIPRSEVRLAVLLPHRPSGDLLDFITSLGISCIYERPEGGYERAEAAASA